MFATVWLVQRGSPESKPAEQDRPGERPRPGAGPHVRPCQNWQSRFLAIGCVAIFCVCLRRRGSPEPKPVGTEHHVTDESG
ncbi:DUF6766 family protein [Amycolatopsis sp. CA-161197]|uniref:DUF6766 family protein n=1 Tax=Amycolatopsis sp. CA-161197 TaxID=3239922 RepID=UPI003D93C08A